MPGPYKRKRKASVIREAESSASSERRKPIVTRRTIKTNTRSNKGGAVRGKARAAQVQAMRKPKLSRAAKPVLNLRESTSDSPRARARAQKSVKTMKAGGYNSNPRDKAERLYRKSR